MTLSEARAIVKEYNSKETHPMGLKLKFVKATKIINKHKLKIASGN